MKSFKKEIKLNKHRFAGGFTTLDKQNTLAWYKASRGLCQAPAHVLRQMGALAEYARTELSSGPFF